MSELLSSDELRDLTSYAQREKQDGWLTERGIPHRVEGRRIIVSRHHLRDWLKGVRVNQSREPDLSTVH